MGAKSLVFSDSAIKTFAFRLKTFHKMKSFLNILTWLRENARIRENPESTHRGSSQPVVKPGACAIFCCRNRAPGGRWAIPCSGASLMGRRSRLMKSSSPWESFSAQSISCKYNSEAISCNVSETKNKRQQNTLLKPSITCPVPHPVLRIQGPDSLPSVLVYPSALWTPPTKGLLWAASPCSLPWLCARHLLDISTF